MKLARAMLIGGVMTAISATAGALALPLFDRQVAVASTQIDAASDKIRWVPPEPTSKSLPAVPVVPRSGSVDPATLLVLTGLLR